MTIEEKLKELILSRYRSVLVFTNSIGMPYATMTSIFKRGINNSSVVNIIKICNALGISADALAQNRIEPVQSQITEAVELNDIVIELKEKTPVTLNGEVLLPNEIKTIVNALEISIEMVKRNRK